MERWEVGDPLGSITMEMVRRAKDLGYIIGSCSDWTVSQQRRIWMEHDIAVAFTVLKHQLDLVKAEFNTEQYYHIGESNMDRHVRPNVMDSSFSIPTLLWDRSLDTNPTYMRRLLAKICVDGNLSCQNGPLRKIIGTPSDYQTDSLNL